MAKPETLADGNVNLMVWHCIIPGKAGVSPLNPFTSQFCITSIRFGWHLHEVL